MCNVYSPNEDKPQFFVKVAEMIEECDNCNIMWGGDFNLVLNTKLDRYNSMINNTKSLEIIQQYMNDAELNDVWRIKNPEKTTYTWFRRSPLAMSRIDYFLISTSIMSKVLNTKIIATPCSDHSMLMLTIQCSAAPRGPGLWQLNTSHLTNKEFLMDLTRDIEHYIERIRDLSHMEKWEKLKLEIRRFCQTKSKDIAVKSKNRVHALYERLKYFRDVCYNDPKQISAQQWQEYEQINAEIDEFLQKRAHGARMRCRARWYDQGERSSKYFFSLEKANASKKQISSLVTSHGETLSSQEGIMNEQVRFYKELYQSDDSVNFSIQLPESAIKLNDEERLWLDRELSYEEITAAVLAMPNDKIPGDDGLPIEVYKVLWSRIGKIYYNAILEALSSGKLMLTARRGIITLIPKKEKDPSFLKNWQPLTMLNCDYKIVAKAISQCMKKVLPSIISCEQTRFMSHRNIATNIRKAIEVIEFTKKNNIPAAIMSIDFEKCFDYISHKALWGSMELFNFGPNIIKWCKVLYTDFVSAIKSNGYISNYFPIQRSVFQGSPLACFLYLLCGQIVNILFKNNKQIKGLSIYDMEVLLSQFADDTDLFLSYDKTTFQQVIYTLRKIEINIGLKVNYDKTAIYRIGSIANSNAKIYTTKNFVWTNDPINILGVIIANDMHSAFEMNFSPILTKTKAVLKCWSFRTLTLSGRVLLVNTLIASLVVYKMSVLEFVPYDFVNKMEALITEFIWKGKRPKIPNDILQLDRCQGGLRLVNLFKKQASLKIKWAFISNDEVFWQTIMYANLDPVIKSDIWLCNLSCDDVEIAVSNKSFWRQVLYAWCMYNFCESPSAQEFRHNIIWYNSLIKVDGALLMSNRAWRAGLLRVEQLFNDNGEIYSYQEICNLYGDNFDWFQYRQLISAIPSQWKIWMKMRYPIVEVKNKYQVLASKEKTSSVVYDYLINDRYKILNRKARWERRLDIDIDDDIFCNLFEAITKVTLCTKYRDFQFRLLHNTIVMNQKLKMWKLSVSDYCTFCKDHVETTTHLFCTCKEVLELWEDINLFIITRTSREIVNILEWLKETILLNTVHPKSSHIINFVVLITKQYIYRQRCANRVLYSQLLIKEIKNIMLIEQNIAKSKNKLKRHFEKWSPLFPELESELEVQDNYISNYIQNM